MTTWPNSRERVGYLTDTLAAFDRNLYGADPVFYCTAETKQVTPRRRCALQSIAAGRDMGIDWHQGEPDLGAAMNRAVSMGENEYQLILQDDFELVAPLDISAGLAFLDSHPTFCAIRYEYPAGTWFSGDVDGFRVVDMHKTRWAFLDSPTLRRRSMAVDFGRYVEGLPHKAAEYRFGRMLAKAGANVAASRESEFRHIGTLPAADDCL